MTTTPISDVPPVATVQASLSQRLRAETAGQHDRMEALMARTKVFASRDHYARFTAAQYLFQQDVESFFGDPSLRDAVPDLQVRGRLQAARDDLADLGATVPDEPTATASVKMPAALGWLYVSEGSTLGAAFLLKAAQDQLGLSAGFGARNLAAYPEGRARVWKRFVAALDAQPAGTHDAVVAGAHAAYDRFGALLKAYFQLD
ncbi:biliverdin-producing heme oxygenase [Comamonadaceae bacterium PP-2]